MMRKSFAKKIKSLRKKTGLSQSKFAALVGVNLRSLQNWEIDRVAPENQNLLLLGMKHIIDEYLSKKKE